MASNGRLFRAALALAVSGIAVASSPAGAQGVRPAAPPSLEGLWTNGSLTELERPDEFDRLEPSEAAVAAYEAARRGKPPKLPDDTVGGADSEWWETDVPLARISGRPRSSWLVEPANGKLPYTDAAKAANKARKERSKTDFDNPEARTLGDRCLSTEASGPPLMNGGYNDNYQIVQTLDHVLIVSEYMHDVRVIRLGETRRLPPHVRVWNGESVGRWENRTLVVETTNFTPAEVNAPDGNATADMQVEERFTPVAPGELLYQFTVTNPARFTQPWRGEMTLRAPAGPIFEFACHEANYSLRHMLSGARQQEAGKTER